MERNTNITIMAAITGIKKGTSDPVGTVTGSGAVEFSTEDTDNNEIGSVVAGKVVVADSVFNVNTIEVRTPLAESTTDFEVVDKADGFTQIGTYNGISGKFEVDVSDTTPPSTIGALTIEDE